MNKSVKEAVSFIKDFKNYVKDVEIVICPSFTLLNKLNESIKKELQFLSVPLNIEYMYDNFYLIIKIKIISKIIHKICIIL